MACEQTQPPWQDISDHHIQFVSVDDNVQLEVLDWGGDGRPVVLLAGLGNTAHVYDELAPKLAGDYHVYGIIKETGTEAFTPTLGYASFVIVAAVLIFYVCVGGIFMVGMKPAEGKAA